MATLKQKKALAIMAENGGVASRAMLEAGYSPMTAQDPKKLTESRGYKELCAQHGLTPDLIIKSLTRDIKKKPQRRVGELRLGADILKMTGRGEGEGIIAVQVNISDDRSSFA